MRMALFVVALLAVPSGVVGQVGEVGGGISSGCIGDSSGFCGEDRAAMWAAHTSLWIDDRLEIGIRSGVLPLPATAYIVARDSRFDAVDDPAVRGLSRIDVSVRDRSRRLLTGEAIYHFGRGRRVRPMLGFGLGDTSNRLDQSCAPAGCERLMPILSSPVGRHATHGRNVTLIAGASGRIRENLQVKAGVRLHNPAGEETSTSELFVAAGFRFAIR